MYTRKRRRSRRDAPTPHEARAELAERFSGLAGGLPHVHRRPFGSRAERHALSRIHLPVATPLVGAGFPPFRATVAEIPLDPAVFAPSGPFPSLDPEIDVWILMGRRKDLPDGGAKLVDITTRLTGDPVGQGEVRITTRPPDAGGADLEPWRSRIIEIGALLAEDDTSSPAAERPRPPTRPNERAAWLRSPAVRGGLVRGVQRVLDALSRPDPGPDGFWDADPGDGPEGWRIPSAARSLAAECLDAARMRADGRRTSPLPSRSLDGVERTILEPREVPPQIREYVRMELHAADAATTCIPDAPSAPLRRRSAPEPNRETR